MNTKTTQKFSTTFDTLCIVNILSRQDPSAQSIADGFTMSIPTVKRHIAAARTMGADIVSIKKNGQSVYHLLNWEEIREKTTRWLMLEHEQNLKGPM